MCGDAKGKEGTSEPLQICQLCLRLGSYQTHMVSPSMPELVSSEPRLAGERRLGMVDKALFPKLLKFAPAGLHRLGACVDGGQYTQMQA